MRISIGRIPGILATAILAAGSLLPVRGASVYFLVREIQIGGIAGTPSLAIDADGRKLYITHSTKIEVVDLDKEESVGVIADTPSVRGFALAPKLRRGFSSNSRDGNVSVIDLQSLGALAKVKTVPGAGPMLFDPGAAEVYVFNTRTPSATVIGAASGKVTATIPLAGKPQIAVADSEANRVYCAFFDRNEVAVLDTKTHAVTATWLIAPGKEPAGVAVDAARQRVFVGCRNKLLLMLDGATGKVVASVPIGTGVDGTAFDPESGMIFCANSDGTTTIAHEDSPEKLSVVQTLDTERNARILALDTRTHKIYLATTDFEAQAEPDPGERQARPRTLANTLKILVYGPAKP